MAPRTPLRSTWPSGAGARPLLPCLALLAGLALAGDAGATGLALDWYTGVSPVSWGLGITPSPGCRQIRLTVESSGVSILAARGGPLLPKGWTVALTGYGVVVASGPEPLPASTRLPAFFILETNRATGGIDGRGAKPVRWRLELRGADGKHCAGSPLSTSFPPMLELSDAVSRGLVFATSKPRSPWGPVDITVDNPTQEPVCLDLPPGAILRGDGTDWVVGLVRPFQLMRRQKTGRTVTAFPLVCSARGTAPSRLSLSSRTHEKAGDIAEIALAVARLQDDTRTMDRKQGPFESWQPFDFWPLVLQWTFWRATGDPPLDTLVQLCEQLLGERAAAGDPRAGEIDPVIAAAEVSKAAADVEALRAAIRASAVAVATQASQARFR